MFYVPRPTKAGPRVPSRVLGINRASPLADFLSGLYAPVGGSGPELLVDLTGRVNLPSFESNANSFVAGDKGVALRSPSSNLGSWGGTGFGDDPNAANSGVTLSWFGRREQIAGGDVLIDLRDATGNSYAYITSTSDSDLSCIFRQGSSQNTRTATQVGSDRDHLISAVGVNDVDGGVGLYVDGALDDSSASGRTLTAVGDRIGIHAFATGGGTHRAHFYWMAWWHYDMPSSLIAALNEHPFDFLKTPPRLTGLPSGTPAASGGTVQRRQTSDYLPAPLKSAAVAAWTPSADQPGYVRDRTRRGNDIQIN